jgi:copper transport protein
VLHRGRQDDDQDGGPMMRPLRHRVVAALLMAAAVVLGSASFAAAHDELVSSIPANSFTVNKLPPSAKLTFAEETHATDVIVKSFGRSLPVSDVPGDVHSVSVSLAGVPATETVALGWRAVDAHDGHVTSGTIAFHLLDHISGLPAAAAPTPTLPIGLASTIPAQGYSVTQVPGVARFTFANPIRVADVTVKAAGRSLPVMAVPGVPTEVSVALAGVPATEAVQLSLRAVGSKGHIIADTLAFHVLDHIKAASESASSAPQHLHTLSVVAHLFGYLAMAVLIGGLFFISALWPAGARDPRTRVLLGTAAAVGVASAIASIYVTTRQVAPLTFRDAIAQHFGRVSIALTLMWMLTSIVIVAMLQQPDVVRRTAWRFSAIVVCGGLIRAVGMSAHGTQGTHATLGLLIDFLHLSAVSAWVGGLAVMSVGLLPRRRLDELEIVVPRFSKVAATSVVLVITSGVLLAWEVIGSLHGLWSTHYGHILIVKVGLVSGVVLAAMVSKRWVERTLASAVSAGSSSEIGSFVASVGAETALVIAVLGAASVLVTASPGL